MTLIEILKNNEATDCNSNKTIREVFVDTFVVVVFNVHDAKNV